MTPPEIEQAEIERYAALISGETAGKVTVEYGFKDGRWTRINVSVTFPRRVDV